MDVLNFDSLQQFLRVNDIFSRFGLKRIGVFGSFVREEPFNDIDLLVEDKLGYEARMALKEYLQVNLNVPVDIMMKEYAEPIILHRALKDIKYATAA